MRKIITALSLLFIYTASVAQQRDIIIKGAPEKPDINKKKPIVIMPSYPGGVGNYLMKNVKITRPLKGNEIIKFLVNEHGDLSQFIIVSSLGADVDNAIINALKVMPKWKPATEDGVAVPMWYNLPIAMN